VNNPLVAESETDFNTKWPFKVIQGIKVIYFSIIEEPLMGYIVYYNKCGLMNVISPETRMMELPNG